MARNREIKDSIFRDLFGDSRNFLELYNAISDQNLKYEETTIQKLEIKDTVYKSLKNDLSFVVNGKIIVLVEHQSTLNPNMPLRCFMYAAKLYESIVPARKRYAETLQKIPAPDFFVIYNGKMNMPDFSEQKLSDAFMSKNMNTCELNVKILNVRTTENNLNVLNKCNNLKEYVAFFEQIERFCKLKHENPFREAITFCIKNNILKSYLEVAAVEVENFLIAKYSYEDDLAVHCEEAEERGFARGMELGKEQGIEQGIEMTAVKYAVVAVKKFNVSVEDASKEFGVDVSKIQKALGE